MAPEAGSSRTPSRRNAQQSYATETKKLAGRRLAAVILQPISETFPHTEPVGFLEDFGFELRQLRIGIHVVQRTQELPLGEIVSMRAVAADAHTEGAR